MENKIELKFGDEVAVVEYHNLTAEYGKFISYSVDKSRCLISTQNGIKLSLIPSGYVFENKASFINTEFDKANQAYEKHYKITPVNEPI